jgi:hypothetical protein
MMLVVGPAEESAIRSVLEANGETVTAIGRISAREKSAVIFRGKLNLDG